MSETVERQLERLERSIAELQAKDEIREALHRYCVGVDRCDIEVLKSVYHSDAIDVHGHVFIGNAHEFAEYIVPMLSKLRQSRHLVSNITIELDLDGDRAFTETLYISTSRVDLDDGRCVDLQSDGRYLDVFERRDEKWKILHRVVVGDKSITHLVDPRDQTNTNTERHSKANPEDLSYRRFDILDVSPDPTRLDGDVMDFVRAMFSQEGTTRAY